MQDNATPHLILKLQGISKRFGDVVANDEINLEIRRGEIHALLGENGAGKSTLMNILAGIYTPDEGTIYFDGEPSCIRCPLDSINLGIGMVHQHFKLIDTLTVSENILLGHENLTFHINHRKIDKDISNIASKYNLPAIPDRYIYELSAGECQRVEILKLLYRDAKLLILDEPTSVLTPQEADDLFENLLKMRDEGKTIIFISHKLAEVMRIADRVSILRRGKVTSTFDISETNEVDLARQMMGSDQAAATHDNAAKSMHSPSTVGDTVLSVQDLTFINNKGQKQLDEVSFDLCEGEIFGVAGVSGNGQSQLAFCLTGLLNATQGSIHFRGSDITKKDPKFIADCGISHVPEDRLGVGSIADFSCYENAILKTFDRAPFSRRGFLNARKMKEHGDQLFGEYDVRVGSGDLPIKFLSGGNIQKLILGRELGEEPSVIIAVHPTYGLDIAAVSRIHQLLLQAKKRGCAIMLISEDLDELFEISDRIAVMFDGSMSKTQATSCWTTESIGLSMTGVAANCDPAV